LHGTTGRSWSPLLRFGAFAIGAVVVMAVVTPVFGVTAAVAGGAFVAIGGIVAAIAAAKRD
jgi:hypothetical protein